MGKRGQSEGTYRRKGKGWQAAVMLGGRRYWLSAPTLQEARRQVRELVLRHQAGELAPPTRYTLAQWCQAWLEEARGRLRPSTVHDYQRSLSPLLPLLGRQRLRDISPAHVQAALLRLRGQVGERRREKAWVALHACLEAARRLGLITSNPCAQVGRPRPERREARDWTLADMRRFLAVALEDGRPLASMLALMLLTGLRPGEAMGLRWEDVDMEAAALTVRRSVTWAGREWHVSRPKTKAGERTVALPALALRLLGRLPRGSVHLFWAERPPTSKQVSRVMGELCERAGVPRRPAHYLRHAHASLLVGLGVDVKTAQRRLGHASANMTLDTYAHHLPGGEMQVARLLDDALGEGP